ncbi:MAG: ATP-grasp domain-containing protein [Clostridiales bacterium]|nr:ATP-grasp domain-containing protein [Clostridiales bacterium]
MILGASIVQTPLIEQSIKAGYETIVVSPDLSAPGHSLANTNIRLDVRDKDGVLKTARSHRVDGITTDQTDVAVRTVAYVAEKMGLPGIGYETALLFTDKYLMREKCKSLGIKTLEYRLCNSLDDAIDFFEEIGTGVAVKPVDNQGSRGVSLVKNMAELVDAYDEAKGFASDGRVLVEEFMHGQEFVVDGIAYDHQFENLILGDYIFFDLPNVFAASRLHFPSKANPDIVSKVGELNKKIITGFGLSQGRTHSEFIADGNDIALVEVAARGGGVFNSSDLVPLSTGVSSEAFLLNIALGVQSGFPEIKKGLCTCCYRSFFLPEGEVVSIEGVDEINSYPFTHRNNLCELYIGKKIAGNSDKTSRFFVIVSAKTHDELDLHVNMVKEALSIKVFSQTHGHRDPIWD